MTSSTRTHDTPAHKDGKETVSRTRGVRTLEDLKARCWVDEDSGCWHWRGGLSKGKPTMWFSPLKSRTSLSQAIGYLKTGAKLKRGMICYCKCQTPDCVNFEHRVVGTKKGLADVLRKQGRLAKPAIVRAAMSRARSTGVLSDADILEIRTSSASCTEEAKRFGVSVSHVSRIRNRQTRPVGVQGSSVFNMGAIA